MYYIVYRLLPVPLLLPVLIINVSFPRFGFPLWIFFFFISVGLAAVFIIGLYRISNTLIV